MVNLPFASDVTVLTVVASYFTVIGNERKKCVPVALIVVPDEPAGGLYVTVGVVTLNDAVGVLTVSDAAIVLDHAVADNGPVIVVEKPPDGATTIAFGLSIRESVVPELELPKSV